MCLTYPAKILKIKGEMALIQDKKKKLEVNIGMLKNVKVGDYILYNANLAIKKVSQKEAKEIMDIFGNK